MKRTILYISVLLTTIVQAQDSADKVAAPGPLKITGYVEAYYGYDFNKPLNNLRPNFLYSYNRHNETNLNLGFVKANYQTERVRANLALGAGTYMNANYAAEAGTLKNIFEANAGYKLSARKNLWLDIGIMPAHIGYESAIGKDNWTLTRSLVAENSPYFESGIKAGYTTDDGKLQVAALMLNGWQRITRVEGNSLISYGSQLYWKPSDRITVNYSTFFGTDKPDSARLWRSYHNVYGIFQITPRLGFTAGFDIGREQTKLNGKAYHTWYTPVGILRITPGSKWAFALRGEYFSDEDGVIISTGTANGFKTIGGSINVDYLPLTNIALRMEARYLKSNDDIFLKNNAPKNDNTSCTFSTAINF